MAEEQQQGQFTSSSTPPLISSSTGAPILNGTVDPDMFYALQETTGQLPVLPDSGHVEIPVPNSPQNLPQNTSPSHVHDVITQTQLALGSLGDQAEPLLQQVLPEAVQIPQLQVRYLLN